jgi:hypothetical protein
MNKYALWFVLGCVASCTWFTVHEKEIEEVEEIAKDVEDLVDETVKN